MDWVSKRLGLAKGGATPSNAVAPKEKGGVKPGPGGAGGGESAFSKWTEGGTAASERDRNATKIRRALRTSLKELSICKSSKDVKILFAQALQLFGDYPFEIGKKEIAEKCVWAFFVYFSGTSTFCHYTREVFLRVSKVTANCNICGMIISNVDFKTHLKVLDLICTYFPEPIIKPALKETKLGVCIFGLVQAISKVPSTAENITRLGMLQEKDANVGISMLSAMSKILKYITLASSGEIGLPLPALVEYIQVSCNTTATGCLVSRILKIGISLVRLYAQDISFLTKAQENSSMTILLDSMEAAAAAKMAERAVMISKLIVEVLKESLKKGSELLDEFKKISGYRRIGSIALAIAKADNIISDSVESDIGTIVEVLEDLVYASRDDLTLSIEDGLTPYQHSDFRIPIAGSGATISSIEGLIELKRIICINPDRGFENWNRSYLISLQAAAGSTLLEILKLNPINYFVMEKTRILLDILQDLHTMDGKVQVIILDIVAFIVMDLNYVPFKELVFLCETFRGTTTLQTLESVCDLFLKLIDRYPKFKDVGREIGLVAMFGFMLQDYLTGSKANIEKLQSVKPEKDEDITPKGENAPSPTVGARSPASDAGAVQFQPNDFCLSEPILKSFETMMKICSRLLEASQNAVAFRRASRGAVYDLLGDARLRPGLLIVISQLVRDAAFAQSPSSSVSHQEMSELNKLIEVLISARKEDIDLKLDILSILRDALHSSPVSQVSFKESGGFIALISTFLSLEGVFVPPIDEISSVSSPDNEDIIIPVVEMDDTYPEDEPQRVGRDLKDLGSVAELISTTFEVFIVAIQDSRPNSNFVRDEIGYKSIEDAIRMTGILLSDYSPVALSGLFGIAMENVAAFNVLRNDIRDISRNMSASLIDLTGRKGSLGIKSSAASLHNQSFDYKSSNASSASRLDRICAPSSVLLNTGIIVNVLNLLNHIGKEQLMIPYLVIDMILRLASCNRHNQVYLNEAGVLRVLFDWLFQENTCWFLNNVEDLVESTDNNSLRPEDAVKGAAESQDSKGMSLYRKKIMDKIIAIATRLIEVGVSDQELRYLFHVMLTKHAHSSSSVIVPGAGEGSITGVAQTATQDYSSQISSLTSERHLVLLDLILHGLRHGRSPEYIHFNMLLNDYCCLSIPDFARVFPPATGYTFLCWFQVERFDSKSEIPLLHMIDAEDKTRLRIVIESVPTSRKIRIDTFKTTVRFDSAVIKEGEWYHLAVVHQKPRMTASTIDVYLNGIAIDHLKCGYLGHPGSVSKIRTYFGVPPELALSEKSQSIWNIGPSYFIEETLMDANGVRMISNIGFEYSSNFQGTFSKYQTHEILHTLSIDSLNSKSNHVKDISNGGQVGLPADRIVSSEKVSTPTTNLLALMLSQVKGTGNSGGLEVLEDKILFAITAKNSLEVRLRDHINEVNSSILLLAERLNPQARVLLSQSAPKIALDQNYSPVVTLIKGNPLFVCPQRVIDGIWKLGGCSILLMLVDRSETTEALYKSTAAIVESIREENASTDDSNHGYLAFIDRKDDPVITNVTAVKHLFIDGFLWKAPYEIKKYFISQFSEFVTQSSKKAYNVRKLNRLGMTRKLLLMIQAQVITEDLLPDVIVLLKAFLKSSFSAEAVRSFCTFIMATLPKDGDKGNERLAAGAAWRSRSNTYSSRAANIANIKQLHIEAKKTVPKLITEPKSIEGKSRIVMLRNLLMEVLLDLINDPAGEYAIQFANIITSRWILLFFNKNLDVYTVVIATRILSRLCLTMNPAYSSSKFREGFLILGNDLMESAFVMDIFPSLFSILCGSDISPLPIGTDYELGNLLGIVKPADLTKKRNLSPDAMRIIALQIRRMVEALYDESGKSTWSAMLQSDVGKTARGESENEKHEMENRYRDTCNFLETTFELIREMYLAADDVKDIVCRPEVIDEILAAIFPILMQCTPLSMEVELITQHSVQVDTKDGTPQVEIKEIPPTAHPNGENDSPFTLTNSHAITSNIPDGGDKSAHTPSPLTPLRSLAKRLSLLGSERLPPSISLSTDKLGHCISLSALNNQELAQAEETTDPITESAVDLILAISIDSILGTWKPLYAVDIILKATPPTTRDNEAFFQSIIISHILNGMIDELYKKRSLLFDNRVISNLCKFLNELLDKVWLGTLIEGSNLLFEFLTTLIEALQQGDQDALLSKAAKSEVNAGGLSKLLNRAVLYQFSKFSASVADPQEDEKKIEFLTKCLYHQRTIFSQSNNDLEFFRCMIHHLFSFLISENNRVKISAMNLWKLMLLSKPSQVLPILKASKGNDQKDLIDGFSKILEMDITSFLGWVDSKRDELAVLFQESASKAWEVYLANEQRLAKDNLKLWSQKRCSKLKKGLKKVAQDRDTIDKYCSKTQIWINDMQNLENSRLNRYKSDISVSQTFVDADWAKVIGSLTREKALWGLEKDGSNRWKLDFVEGRARMRKKLRRNNAGFVPYLSKHEKLKADRVEGIVEKKSSYFELKASEMCLSADKPNHKRYSLDVILSKVPQDEAEDDDVSEAASFVDGDFTMGVESTSQADDPGVRDDISDTDLDDYDADEGTDEAHTGSNSASSEEDKNRKILRLLDAGDTVMETFNSARVLGLDICEGLLLLCKNNMYLINNYYRRADGELVDIDNVVNEERNIYHIMLENQSGKKSAPEDGERYFRRRWNWDDVREVHKRLFLSRGVALEIFLCDGRNYILTFLDTKTRDMVYNRIVSKATNQNSSESVVGVNASAADPLTAKTFSNVIFGGSALADLTQKWCQREISNFQYLIHLNTLAGRSYNDLTQYPVFPWILADYESEELDLQNPATFRNLSKPMGAQGEARAEKFEERFQLWDDPVLPPCHYGTHYSSAMIVCSYLIRLEPFTQQYLKLQGGHFDHPDRLFHSIAKSWASASQEASTDVRELIPEFFFLPEFMQNLNKFDFGEFLVPLPLSLDPKGVTRLGKKQTGEDINDIILPPWAKGDPRLFIIKHREALESEYVSSHLNEWIDLIFGFKQTGEEAVKALNVFHYLSYEGAVDMDAIEDLVEKQATIGIIHNFGQTPRQLFKKPHPRRNPENIAEYKISRSADFLIHSSQTIKTVGGAPIGDIRVANEKLYAVGSSRAFFPGNLSRTIEWDYLDNSLRLLHDSKVAAVFENLHIGHITCASFIDQNKLITAGSDMTLCIWRYRNRNKKYDLQLLECLRGHRGKVLTFAVSKTFSLVASGGLDNLVILWDLIRMQYTRALPEHDGPIRAITINENTGDISTCTDLTIYLWSINGDPICSKSLVIPIADYITSCTFYEGKLTEQIDTGIVLTGHKKGTIKIWKKEFTKKPTIEYPGIESPAEYFWDLKLIRTLNCKVSPSVAVTCIYLPSSQKYILYGDALGRINGWMFPDGSGTEVHFSHTDSCFRCSSKFNVLERKINCRACGGILCINCADVGDKTARLCAPCSTIVQETNATQQQAEQAQIRKDLDQQASELMKELEITSEVNQSEAKAEETALQETGEGNEAQPANGDPEISGSISPSVDRLPYVDGGRGPESPT
ncbi:hypothetical protein HDU67_004427 [Dinochytrium kinnereticum]|nr:hypothetical protein HDU67_004427 [Dinochytrium kinnereticum]